MSSCAVRPAFNGGTMAARALASRLAPSQGLASSAGNLGWQHSSLWSDARLAKGSIFVPAFEASPRLRKIVAPVAMARKKSGFAQLLTKGFSGPPAESRPKAPLKQGNLSPTRPVPPHIPRPPYADSGVAPPWTMDPQVHGEEGIRRMREAGELAARVRDHAGTLVKPGVTTDEIDRVVHEMIIEAGAYPSPLNYAGFPKSVCTSVNECICHGIPDSRPLQDGDIINIDVTVYLNGYHGDTSKTFFCGNVSKPAQKLVQVTEEALDAAIALCGPDVEFKKIGHAIHAVADKHGYGVVRKFIGHGVGSVFHAGPAVLHYRNNEPGRMQVGQTFTIEPMFTMGGVRDVMWDDGWTAVTADGTLTAQFEHTLLITDTGVEVLTKG
ncbi:hypothetical protein CLOM_g18962 [Closterium sp. NIES-68]|nr:hypothetical protein CLOM_g18962 [Closterium sp. NIES-68]GJP78383.1 hypothetical protein CLOP_g8689 [Closterium sp. NIES-67]